MIYRKFRWKRYIIRYFRAYKRAPTENGKKRRAKREREREVIRDR